MTFQKILLPLDLSAEGERALPVVAELARALRASVVLLHVVENVGAPPVSARVPPPKLLPGTVQELARGQKHLDERRASFPAGVEVTTEVVVAPSVAHAILDYAAQQGCDAVALSTHGRTGFRRLVTGSVAEAVLRAARVPVLAFPRQE
ncbi:MAG TPA: universal stress protein [Planctomycetota bacterium]